MSSVDIIFAVVLTVFILFGIWKGFFREVLGLVGIVGGIFFAIVGFGPVSQQLNRLFPDIPSIIWPILSFILIFLCFYILSRVLAALLSKITESIKLGWLNRLLGGAIGGLKGAVLISFILLLVGFLPFQAALQEVRGNSRLYEPLQEFVPALYDMGSGVTNSSIDFEKKISDNLERGKVKITEEMVNYFFHGKKDPTTP